MPTPQKPGVYIVTLNNCEPISVNRGDPRYEDTAITVGCCNIKVGKADKLARREGDYERTFRYKNVNFYPIPISDCTLSLKAIETELKKAFAPYRIKNPNTGKPTEWMHSIGLLNILDTIIKILINYNCKYEIIDPYICKY